MNDLVVMHSERPMVSSLLIAEKFDKAHSVILRKIRSLDCSKEFLLNNFVQSDFATDRGRKFECFMMTRDGFTFLCMGLTGKDAAKWKEAYIKAFNKMEKTLLRKSDALGWKQARLQSKTVRKDFTDVVKRFVDYATKQGSKSAAMYYTNITKMEYSALELTEKGQKVSKDFRNTLDLMDLSFLSAAEFVAQNALDEGMHRHLPYKEIYKLAKERVQAYAGTVMIGLKQIKGESDE